MNMVEYCKGEQYKQKTEERTRQDVAEKLEQVNFFFTDTSMSINCSRKSGAVKRE